MIQPLSLASLTDLSTLEQTLNAVGVEGLLASLSELRTRISPTARTPADVRPQLSHRTLRILQRALELDADFLREHPRALFQCLYNRLRWFDAPDAAVHFAPDTEGPWSDPEPHLFELAEHWRRQFEARGDRPWLESLRPLPGELEGDDQILRHDAQVLCAAYSPSGTRLAAGSWEERDSVRIWDLSTGACTHVLSGHGAEVRTVAWSADGSLVAAGSRNHDVHVWDAETGALLLHLPRQEGRVTSVAFSPDGKWLAAANLGWRVRLFEVATGREVRTLEGHQQSVLSVAFHPSGRWLASGASDQTVRIWDLESGAQVACLDNVIGASCVAFSLTGAQLAIASMDGIVLCEVDGWRRSSVVLGQGAYSDVAWIDGDRLGALAHNRVEVLDARSGEVLHTRPYASDGHQRGVSFEPGAKRFALTAVDGRVRVGDLDARPVPSLLAERTPLLQLWGRPGGGHGIVRTRKAPLVLDANGEARALPLDHREALSQAWKVSPDDAWIAYPLLRAGERPFRLGVQLLDAHSLQPTHVLTAPAGTGQQPRVLMEEPEIPIAFSPDGRILAAAVEEDRVRLWRVSDGALLQTLRGPEGPVTWVDFTPDGRCVVAAHAVSSRLLFHPVEGGEPLFDTDAIVHPTPSYAAAADAPIVAIGRESGALVLLDLATGNERVLPVATEPIVAVGLSPDGTRVATSGLDEQVCLFDTRTGALLHALTHPALAYELALGDDVLITLSEDQRTRFFDLATGALRATVDGSVTPVDAVSQPHWESLGEVSLAIHRGLETTPRFHFQDPMEETLVLRGGLLLGRGRNEKDFLYVLKLHESAAQGEVSAPRP